MIYRNLLYVIFCGAIVTQLLLAVQFWYSWDTAAELEKLETHFQLESRLLGMHARLEDRGEPIPHAELEGMLREIETLAAQPLVVGEIAATARSLLAMGEGQGRAAAAGMGGDIHGFLEVIAEERRRHQLVMGELNAQAGRELAIGVIMLLFIPLLATALVLIVRLRLHHPLRDLEQLMKLLSAKNYAAAVTDGVDPAIRPLFDTYNRMVEQVQQEEVRHRATEDLLLEDVERKEQALGREVAARRQAEREYQRREGSLRHDVDSATKALLHQQVALDRAERLAALGDLSARLAHQIRNPLSGVLMALNNLRADLEEPEYRERIEMSLRELERVVDLLNRVLADVRAEPEAQHEVDLRHQVEELLGLLRYQLPQGIEVHNRIPADLRCRLPAAATRNVIMNLVINAAQALDDKARDGVIEVHASREGGELQLAVTDDGPGFPETLLEEGPHDYLSRRKGGTGLGLAMVRRFANHQSGRLELSNRQGGGAVVRLRLPQESRHE